MKLLGNKLTSIVTVQLLMPATTDTNIALQHWFSIVMSQPTYTILYMKKEGKNAY